MARSEGLIQVVCYNVNVYEIRMKRVVHKVNTIEASIVYGIAEAEALLHYVLRERRRSSMQHVTACCRAITLDGCSVCESTTSYNA